MKKLFLPLLLAAATYLPAQAQAGRTTPAEAPAAAVSPSHRQAAENLLAIIYPPGTFDKLIDQMLEAQIKQRPEIAQVEPEMRAFFRKYMSWESLKPDMEAVYARTFTEPELLEITRFYQTPTGRKMSGAMPQLMKAGMELGQQRVQDHLPELQKTIENKLKAEQSKASKRLHE